MENYSEVAVFRFTAPEDVQEPTFVGADVDCGFEAELTVKLKAIQNTEINAEHNTRMYIFEILAIDKLDKEE